VSDAIRELLRFTLVEERRAEPAFAPSAVMLWHALVGVTTTARFPGMLRHLRVLPISSRRLHVLLVAWPAVLWVTIAAILVPVRMIAFGRGLTPSFLALLCALTGISALWQALTLRLAGVVRWFMFSGLAGLAAGLGYAQWTARPDFLAAAAVVTLAAAVFLNRLSLSHSATYKAREFGSAVIAELG
jgi:hypothetical protein